MQTICRAIFWAVVVGALSVAPAFAKPNIVLIMTDDQDAASVSKMPQTMNRMAMEGTTFTTSVVNFALCCPSRATLLTGQHSTHHRVQGNQLPDGGYAKLDHANTLAVWLKNAGYATALIGKYLNNYGIEGSVPTTIPPGWTEWQGLVDPYGYFDWHINDNGVVTHHTSYQTDGLTDRAVDFIASKANSSQPFFLWLSYMAPHVDSNDLPKPAPRHAGMFSSAALPKPPSFNEADVSDKPAEVRWAPLTSQEISTVTTNYRRRLETLMAVDEGVGRVINALQSAEKMGNTVIIFTSDNGWFLGQHRIFLGKNTYYEEAIRVPLILRGPNIPKNAKRFKLVSNVDVAPTIVQLAGATPQRVMDGKSLLPLLANPSIAWRSAVFLDGVGRPDNTRGPYHPKFDGIRTPRYTYVELASGGREFYDLLADPYQLKNIPLSTPAYSSTIADLQSKLAALKACAGAKCWVTSPDITPAASD
jgi:N-acetylglucosamine-6-sulfatase